MASWFFVCLTSSTPVWSRLLNPHPAKDWLVCAISFHVILNLNIHLCVAGLASRCPADPDPLLLAADAHYDHPQHGLAHGSRRVRGPAGNRLEVRRVAVSLCAGKMVLPRSHACRLILHRGRYGNQFEGLSQQDSGISCQGPPQTHNTGATHPRTQQGKRSKGRHGDKRARYGNVDIYVI